MQDLAMGLAELQPTGLSPATSLPRSLCRAFPPPGTSKFPQLGVICKRTEDALSALIQVLNKAALIPAWSEHTSPAAEMWGQSQGMQHGGQEEGKKPSH